MDRKDPRFRAVHSALCIEIGCDVEGFPTVPNVPKLTEAVLGALDAMRAPSYLSFSGEPDPIGTVTVDTPSGEVTVRPLEGGWVWQVKRKGSAVTRRGFARNSAQALVMGGVELISPTVIGDAASLLRDGLKDLDEWGGVLPGETCVPDARDKFERALAVLTGARET